jgi:hypothetical protein
MICNDGTPEEHGAWFEYARSLLPDCTVLRQPNAGLMGAGGRSPVDGECHLLTCGADIMHY